MAKIDPTMIVKLATQSIGSATPRSPSSLMPNTSKTTLIIPKAPTFRITPERSALAGEGAAGCASGTHPCKGMMHAFTPKPVSYTHLRAHETRHDLVCRLLLEKKKQTKENQKYINQSKNNINKTNKT